MKIIGRHLASSLGGIVVSLYVQNAHAEEPPPSPPPVVTPSNPQVDPHDERLRFLRERTEEINAEAELERATRRLNEAKRETPPSPMEEPTLTPFHPGRILFSNVFGLGFSTGFLGSLTGLYNVGPFVFSRSHSSWMDQTFLEFSPSADLVISKHVTLGGTIDLQRIIQKSATGTDTPIRLENSSIGVAPRVGFIQSLGGGVWFWPRLSVNVGEQWSSAGQRSTPIGATLDAAFVFPMSRWLYIQVAPHASYTHTDTSDGNDYEAFDFGTAVRLGLAL